MEGIASAIYCGLRQVMIRRGKIFFKNVLRQAKKKGNKRKSNSASVCAQRNEGSKMSGLGDKQGNKERVRIKGGRHLKRS